MPPTSRSPVDRRMRLGVLLLVVLGAAWRIAGLDAESFWHDEVITYDLVTQPLDDALADLAQDGHPPLYPLLLRGWASVFGTSPTALRALSVVPGTLAILLLFAVARRWRGAVAGLAAALLAAFSTLLVRYSQEARDYALFFLLATGSFAALDRATREPTAARLGAWSLALALTMWSSVFGLAVAVTQVLWLAGLGVSALAPSGRPRPSLRAAARWFVALVAAFLAYAPWLIVLARRAGEMAVHFWASAPGWTDLEGTIVGFAGTRRGFVMLLPLALVGAWRETIASDADRRRGTLLLAWVAGPVLVPFLFSHVAFPVFVPRGAIVAGGAFLLLVALGLDALRGRRPWFLGGTVAILLALALGIHRHVTRVEREDWRGVARYLSAHADADDLVLVAYSRERLAVRIYAPDLDVAWGYAGAAGPESVSWRGEGRLWVVRSEHVHWPPETFERWSAAGWRSHERLPFPRLILERWER